MPIFEYKALTDKGKTTTGILDADTARDARVKLRKERIHVVEIRRSAEKKDRKKFLQLPERRSNLHELALVTRQLATLLEAGIPLAESLRALIEQVGDRGTEKAFRDIREKVTQGLSFADALAAHPYLFNNLYVSMVRSGEASGNLDEVLSRLADYVQKQAQMRNKVMAALTYPMIMIVVMALVVSILMTFVVPKLLEFAKSSKVALPLPTLILDELSTILHRNWFLLFLGLLAAIYTFQAIKRTNAGRLAWDRLLLRLPIFGELFRKQAVSRFAVTLSALLRTGVPILSALRIVRDIVDNRVLANVLDDVHDRILEGADIATPLKRSGVFPPAIGYMIAVGEQSGQLEEILTKLSQSYDHEIEMTTARVTSIIEPVLTVVMAVVVGFIVLSVIWPILEITQATGM